MEVCFVIEAAFRFFREKAEHRNIASVCDATEAEQRHPVDPKSSHNVFEQWHQWEIELAGYAHSGGHSRP